jgi:hypothetical protein
MLPLHGMHSGLHNRQCVHRGPAVNATCLSHDASLTLTSSTGSPLLIPDLHAHALEMACLVPSHLLTPLQGDAGPRVDGPIEHRSVSVLLLNPIYFYAHFYNLEGTMNCQQSTCSKERYRAITAVKSWVKCT